MANHKRSAYEGLVLSIVLYCCEAWCVTSESMGRIHRFHCKYLIETVNTDSVYKKEILNRSVT